MPFWTTQDTRNALLATLLPGSAVAASLACYIPDKETASWYSALRKPKWAPTDTRFYAISDILTISPLGYASYLVYKNGGGFDYNDTTCALALYGTNIALAFGTIITAKKKNLSCLWKHTLLVHATAVCFAFAFYKIDSHAGLWALPYALWTGFYACLTYSGCKENKDDE
ncbi:unnamed protein product [Auanema sp. JU1783]|nr:unnamed protein product [Auanema sp. JU1783]